ncbi:hypothetical protein [Leclercia sp. CFBP8987]|uniref:hypothetical protein n=1 Tax=Leclercia sp. CFBP8987 TaxID=3096525 RepID=UPI002A6A5C26|nr:hypothetical protein [Leclercia sp. CFBP8987]MDY0922660.1 hypothetical protein [Leclercia sp. CFBP8987]
MLKLICLTLIVIVWGAYSLQFGIEFLSTQGADVWGQFGDFMGGVLNPILSFISICLLIRSVTLQVQSNVTLTQEIKRQELLEDYKKFEMRFFCLIESQESNYSKLRIVIDNGADNDDENTDVKPKGTTLVEYKANNAVTYVDDNLCVLVRGGIDNERIASWLESLDVDDHFFSLVRRFYLLVKLVDDKIGDDKKEEQYELLINLTDEKLLTIIVIICNYFDWDVVEYIKNSGIFKQAKMDNYISNYLG